MFACLGSLLNKHMNCKFVMLSSHSADSRWKADAGLMTRDDSYIGNSKRQVLFADDTYLQAGKHRKGEQP